MSIYLKLYNLLSPKEKRKAFLVILLTLIMGLIDAIGAASIMPFLSLLGNPKVIESSRFLQVLKSFSNIESHQEFTFFVGIFVFMLLVLSLSVKTITTYAQVRFSGLRDFTFSRRLLSIYLSQPYSWYLNKNSSEIGKNILEEVHDVVKMGLVPLINLISSLIVFISMVSLMFIVEPKLALIIASIFITCYLVIYKTLKRFILRIGKDKFEANKIRFNAISEAFGAIKEVKISNLEDEFINRFSNPSIIHAKNGSTAKLIGALPRFALEIVAFGGMFLVILYLLKRYGNINSALPTIGLYAYAGYRILPSLQAIYQSITSIKYSSPAIENLYYDFSIYRNKNKIDKLNNLKIIFPKKSIILKNIKYKYPNKEEYILKNINIYIEANKVTGFVGFTGSGKTTLMDILLGLLKPEYGKINIDEKPLKENDYYAWQKSIGYVPQSIYLADESIESNIAFGYKKGEIDHKRIREVSQIAEIHNFINNDLENKYQTIVGERGIRLSGGQRQRIGIARALYKNPKVLIMDEATSSLDNITERSLMNNIYKLNEKITIIIIAHRLTTIEKCDNIFLLDKGEIVNNGKYEDLSKTSELFKMMINQDLNQ